MDLKIKINPANGGLYCFFEYNGQEYAADLCLIPYTEYTECMVFAAKDGKVTNWGDLYCKRNIPVTKEALRECVIEFIEKLKSKE